MQASGGRFESDWLHQIKNKTMNITEIDNVSLLEDFETKVRCNHYCPVECHHETPFEQAQMRVEILRRMKEKGC